MTTLNKHLFFIFVIIVLHSNYVYGQVTIGSNSTPKIGALLDLKQNDNIGVNSNKGILLPRVKLTKADDITADVENVTASDMSLYIGLVVYNINEEFCGQYPLAKGLHVWNGNFWQYMGPDIKHPEVKEFIDPRDGERYLYRSFGDEAGVWMLENMRTKRLPGATTDLPLHTGEVSLTVPSYGYPSDTKTGWTSLTPGKERYGLIYNWYAYTNKLADPGVDQGEEENGVDNPNSVENIGPNGDVSGKKYVQGICPDGWHVPSDKDWNLLEKEIYNNAEKYADYSPNSFDPSTWQTEWDWTYDLRGSSENSKKGHSYAMINVCSAGGVDNSFGKSFPAEYGGFNAYITGYFFALPTGNHYQPGMCVFASASNMGTDTGTTAAVYVRMIFNPFMTYLDNTKVDRYAINHSAMVAVRCKQNVD